LTVYEDKSACATAASCLVGWPWVIAAVTFGVVLLVLAVEAGGERLRFAVPAR
jgi:hypothetical protein